MKRREIVGRRLAQQLLSHKLLSDAPPIDQQVFFLLEQVRKGETQNTVAQPDVHKKHLELGGIFFAREGEPIGARMTDLVSKPRVSQQIERATEVSGL